MKKIDLTGKRFGRLIAIKDSGKRSKNRFVIWLCHCDCGNLTEVLSVNLRSESTKSCGCLRKELAKKSIKKAQKLTRKHGDASPKEHRLYTIWQNMKKRCLNRSCPDYKYYGGRGITICAEWLINYRKFKEWALSNGYTDNLTIDRINNNDGYYPENCQWITSLENLKKDRR